MLQAISESMPVRLSRPLPLAPTVMVVLCAMVIASAAGAQENARQQHSSSYIAGLFRSANFDRFASGGRHDGIQWNVRTLVHGLSIQQRIVAHIEIDIPGSELVKRAADGQLVALAQVEDAAGHRYRDFGFIDLKPIKPELKKRTWESTWEAYALPGVYKVSLLLYDRRSHEHSFIRIRLRVHGIRHDPFPAIWQGVPDWEFWAPLEKLPDEIYRPDIQSPLHLVLATHQPIQVDVLADLTPSDLFHGSSRFYDRYLSVALPLLKDLSQIHVANGGSRSLRVATLDLRLHKITFEQDDGGPLNWTALKTVLNPESGPGMVNVQELGHKHETPDFLRDELLRRLTSEPQSATVRDVGKSRSDADLAKPVASEMQNAAADPEANTATVSSSPNATADPAPLKSAAGSAPATRSSDGGYSQPAGKDFPGKQLGHDAPGLTATVNEDGPAPPAKPTPSPEPYAGSGDQISMAAPAPPSSSAVHSSAGRAPFRVFIVIGSPMDFYAFHHFPPVDPALAGNCVVYYLQFEANGGHLNGALGKVRKMLKPLAIHTIKVRSAESVRHALATIVREIDQK